MEPFRPVVDWYVYCNREKEFNQEYKYELINLLNVKVNIGGREHYLTNAIKIYVNKLFRAIEKKSLKELEVFQFL